MDIREEIIDMLVQQLFDNLELLNTLDTQAKYTLTIAIGECTLVVAHAP